MDTISIKILGVFLLLGIMPVLIFGQVRNPKGVGFKMSEGVYRLPYENGTIMRVTQDHITHVAGTTFDNKLDLAGVSDAAGNTSNFRVVAAADGIVRRVEDTHTGCCSNPNPSIANISGCTACNNYVWIEHPNGEWTKYTHFQTNSVVVSPNQNVCAGDILGIEGDVGASAGSSTNTSNRIAVACDSNSDLQDSIDLYNATATNPVRCAVHLHFEVNVPDNPTSPVITISGGFMTGTTRTPLFCRGESSGIVEKNEQYLTGPCNLSCLDNINLENQTIRRAGFYYQANNTIVASNSYLLTDSSNATFRAGDRVVLKPGFSVRRNAYFRAAIGACNESSTDSPNCSIVVGGFVQESTPRLKTLGESTLELSNAPNPFIENTVIKYVLEKEDKVLLEVYDNYGRVVATLQDSFQSKGVYELTFNGGDLATGLYFCVLRAGETTKVHKMMVLK